MRSTIIFAFNALLAGGTLAAEAKRAWTSPKSVAPEFGHGLTEADSQNGWISLFDGKTAFGWQEAKIDDGRLVGGKTTTQFSDCELKGEVLHAGEVTIGHRQVMVPRGSVTLRLEGIQPGPVKLGKDVAVGSLILRPLGLKSTFNGKDFTGWRILPHPRLPKERQAEWAVDDGKIRALGGPAALEFEQRYGDFVLQIDVRAWARLVNGGVFFRAMPGDFLKGYEAQIFNVCYDNDPARPARYSTGAIDDRQLARRLVSRDEQTFTMTVIAHGPHIATWVNGYQLIDWTDTREPHENPRQGLRTEPGTIQLQAHDPDTDLEFANIQIVELQRPR
jgi:hypothetical protein